LLLLLLLDGRLLLLLLLARPDEDRPDEDRLLCALAPLRLFEAVDDRLFELLVLDRVLPAFVWAMSRPPCSFLGCPGASRPYALTYPWSGL
jgi:hypothetical protein